MSGQASKVYPKRAFAKPGDDELRSRLSPEQYSVTQLDRTEPPFQNAFWNHREPGIYVDVVSGEPLFSSEDKIESDCGWPSFSRPLVPDHLVERLDLSHGIRRTEVRSLHGDSHLGHVFGDGPAPTRLRYCINSAALRFVAVDRLVEEGYGEHLGAFRSPEPGPDRKGSRSRAEASPGRQGTEIATLAAGCFWGVEHILRRIPGVLATRVGYTGGHTAMPSYAEVCSGSTGHAEAVEVRFDPERLDYAKLLDYFFRLHDPTMLNRQHNDIGTQYRSAIFFHDEQQRQEAERIKCEINESGRFADPVVTEIVAAGPLYEAEPYHQDYLVRNPHGYSCHVLQV